MYCFANESINSWIEIIIQIYVFLIDLMSNEHWNPNCEILQQTLILKYLRQNLPQVINY